MTARAMTAEQEGYEAYKDGASDIENPYQAGTLHYREWMEGWDRAYMDFAHERYKDELDAAELRRYR